MKKCRNCIQWYYTDTWQGNCKLRNWDRPKWSQGTTTNGCSDYEDKQLVYSNNPMLEEYDVRRGK